MTGTHTITVELGLRSYPIVIGAGLLGGGFDLRPYVAGSDCLIVSNQTVAPLYLEKLTTNLVGKNIAVIELPDGEAYKTTDTLHSVLDKLVDIGASRDSTVIALGGGVVGDIAGFAAASYMRGIGFVQVPTTLLAQVDSSVGGKTGVNHARGKNLIGAFYQPGIVLIDTGTLATLPDRELKAGLAEVIKYGAIADLEFFSWLESNIKALLGRDATALAHAIRRSCELKAEIVAADEREGGRRAILNFGHTFGHAIEHCLGYGEWLHGEAVAAGMVMAAALSDIAPDESARLRALLVAAGLPTAPPGIGARKMLDAMARDKKVQRKQIRFVLLKALGTALVTADYNDRKLQQVLEAAN
ncbi:MAG: 3-dehydroquinate synthase [Gammaproteobacteria bacterium]|nr:3-dehydroquinate synthase [Gammaproteobacteria bacterium]MDH5304930.1 3-dehydroquinate synthase [Gammaproteobacteria bacterium]MDH5321393.1 3-dehydroquinate synthase [Gammaproteobacteria bacterium]